MAAASQPATAGPAATDVAKIWSFVRSVHAYNNKWEPSLCLQRQAENSYTQFAVAVEEWNSSRPVARRLAPIFSLFLKRKGVCGDHGRKDESRGWTRAGLGVEAPCVYRLYGPVAYIERTKQLMIQAANNYTNTVTYLLLLLSAIRRLQMYYASVVRVKKYVRNTE